MMKGLIEALRDDVEQQRETAKPIYVRLLHRGGDADFSDADKAEFKRVAGLLGKDLGQVAAEFQIVQEGRRWQALGDTVAETEAAYEAAFNAAEEYAAETKRLVEERQRRFRELYVQRDEAEQRRRNAYHAREQLEAMKYTSPLHAMILAGIKCAPYSPPPPAPRQTEPDPAQAEGGPFEITSEVRDFTGERYGVKFVRGVGRTTLVQAANDLRGAGYAVRDLSQEPAAPPPAEPAPVEPSEPVAAPPAGGEASEAGDVPPPADPTAVGPVESAGAGASVTQGPREPESVAPPVSARRSRGR